MHGTNVKKGEKNVRVMYTVPLLQTLATEQ